MIKSSVSPMAPSTTRQAPTVNAAAAPIAMAPSVMPRAKELPASTHMVVRCKSRALSARRSARARAWPKAFKVASPWIESNISEAKAP